MNGQLIGTYTVSGGDSYTLHVPADEIGQAKLTAALDAMEKAGTSEMGLRYLAVVISVLTGRSVEEIGHLVPLETVSLMWRDIEAWTDHLRPVMAS